MRIQGILLALILGISLLSVIITAQPGIYTATSEDGFDRILSSVMPGFLSQLLGGGYPNVVDGKHTVFNLSVTELVSESTRTSISDDGTLVVKLPELFINTRARHKHRRHRFLKPVFYVDAAMSKVSCILRFKVTNGKGTHQVDFISATMNVHDSNIDIQSNVSQPFKAAVKSIYKNQIKDMLFENISQTLGKQVATFLSTYTSDIPSRQAVGDWGTIDLSVIGKVQYKPNGLLIGYSGDVQSIYHRQQSPVPRNGLVPTAPPAGSQIQIGLDTFVFNSGFHNFYKKQHFNSIVSKQDSHQYEGAALDTNTWGASIPELKAKYPNHDIRLDIRFGEAPTLHSTNGKLSFRTSVDILVQVGKADKWTTAFIVKVPFTANATPVIEKNSIQIQIENSKAGKISIASSTIGSIDANINVIQDLIPFTVGLTTGATNQYLLKSIPFPLNRQTTLIDPSIKLSENSIVINANLHYQV